MTTIISNKSYDTEFVEKLAEISGENFHKCMQCGTCSTVCPMTEFMDLTTRKLILFAHLGFKERLINANTAWFCAACQSCSVRCPRGIDIPAVAEAIRKLILRENVNFIEPGAIPEEALAELPQIALVSCFRKHTA